MDRNLPRLFFRQFLILFIQAIGFVLIMTVLVIYSVMRGIWEQSDVVADEWMRHLIAYRMDSRFERPLYLIVRVAVLIMMIVWLVAFSQLLEWILGV